MLQVRDLVKRVGIYALGMFALSIGVNISKLAGLGISPVSSVAYTLELITGISMGAASIIVYSFFIFLQILLLRRDYQPLQLLQIVSTFIFSAFVNLTGHDGLLSFIPLPGHYLVQILYVLIGAVFTGFGVFLYLVPDLFAMPPEGLVGALVTFSKERFTFSQMKVMFDVLCGVTGLVGSLLFLGHTGSVREGTILSALLIGRVVGVFNKLFHERVAAFMTQKPPAPAN